MPRELVQRIHDDLTRAERALRSGARVAQSASACFETEENNIASCKAQIEALMTRFR